MLSQTELGHGLLASRVPVDWMQQGLRVWSFPAEYLPAGLFAMIEPHFHHRIKTLNR